MCGDASRRGAPGSQVVGRIPEQTPKNLKIHLRDATVCVTKNPPQHPPLKMKENINTYYIILVTKMIKLYIQQKSSYMDPQELKIYILHDLCVVIMISVFPRPKTAYLVIYKNRPISRLKKEVFYTVFV